jgi:hypothetical protein
MIFYPGQEIVYFPDPGAEIPDGYPGFITRVTHWRIFFWYVDAMGTSAGRTSDNCRIGSVEMHLFRGAASRHLGDAKTLREVWLGIEGER